MEQMQASIEELLGMQGLGSGSWNKHGGVPAAVEREQRTLVREIKVCVCASHKDFESVRVASRSRERDQRGIAQTL